MVRKLSSVSVIIVVRHALFQPELFERLLTALHAHFRDIETVIVANGLPADMSIEVKKLAELIPDCTVLFLSDEVHDDIARLLGIDHAISDFVLFTTPLAAQIAALPAMITNLREGNDLVIGDDGTGIVSDRGSLSSMLFDLFRGAHRLLVGSPYEAQSPSFRIFSRSAALYIATRRDGEVLVRARSLGQGFPCATVPVESAETISVPGMPLRVAAAKSLRLILTGSARPLRLISFLGLAGGLVAVIYGAYAILVYSFKSDVEPGWTTLSLLLAAMLFLFSTQFLFLSEYLVQLLSTVPSSSRRGLVARELRWPGSSASRLNIVDDAGEFHLGAPKPSPGAENDA